MLYNFYISWGKRQEELEQRIELLNKDHRHIIDTFSVLGNKIDFALKALEEIKKEQNKIYRNSDYIKEGTLSIQEKKNYSSERNIIQEISEVKKVVEELKTLILS